MKKSIGSILIMFAIIFAIVETALFGGNLIPKTSFELIYDIIAVVLFIIGFLLFKSKTN